MTGNNCIIQDFTILMLFYLSAIVLIP
jgi:hypothetical protein